MARPSKAWTPSSFRNVVSKEYVTVTAWLDGTKYPDPQSLRRIEAHYGWPVRQQIRLIPEEGTDTRYGEALREVLDRFYSM